MEKYKIYLNNLYIILQIFVFSSCTPIIYDMRNLEKPVTMNANPYVGDSLKYLQLIDLDEGFYSSVFNGISSASNGYQTRTQTANFNNVEESAYKIIGQDPTKIITKTKIDLETEYINALFGLSSRKMVYATGNVQKIKK